MGVILFSIILYFLFPIIVLFLIVNFFWNKKKNKMNKEYPTFMLDFKTGHYKLYDGSTHFVQFRDSLIRIYYNNSKQLLDIPYNSLISIDIANEEQTKSSITLGRLFALGIFAPLWKKEVTENKYYLFLSYYDEYNNEKCLVFNKPQDNDIDDMMRIFYSKKRTDE